MTRSYDDIKIHADIVFGNFDESQKYFIHKYTIHIDNQGAFPFQLLRRRWIISDGLDWKKIVEGDGVIGQQPILYPGDTYSYNSWCPMPTTVGYMDGVFFCIDLETRQEFTLNVPMMTLVAGELLN